MGRICRVIGNWKMNGSRDFVQSHLNALKPALNDIAAGLNVGICPPFTLIGEVAAALQGSQIVLGAQDVSDEPEGAHTGDISAGMLREWQVTQVILGHSERRQGHAESHALVARKVEMALRSGLQPILCVGETQAERDAGQAFEVVRAQLGAVQTQVGDLADCILAYEPVWAIGTGRTATPQQAQEMHAELRELLGTAGDRTSILYGGSVKAENAAELFAQPDIDGGLIGGASLDADEFIAICRAADHSSKG